MNLNKALYLTKAQHAPSKAIKSVQIGGCQALLLSILPGSTLPNVTYLTSAHCCGELLPPLEAQSLVDSPVQISCLPDSVIWRTGLQAQPITLQVYRLVGSNACQRAVRQGVSNPCLCTAH